MRPTVTITRNFRIKADDLTPEVISALAECPRRSVRRIRQDAFENAPVDTGALAASLYVADDQGSDYGEHSAAALYLRHEGNRPDSPAVLVSEKGPNQPLEAIVASSVAHAVYNEYGTGRMPPRPFLVPAVQNDAKQFFREVEEALHGKRNRRVRNKSDENSDVEEPGEISELPAIEGGAGTEAAGAELIEAAPLLLI